MLALAQLRLWPLRRLALAAGAAALAAAVTGIPTDLIDTPLFGRQIEPTVWAYPVWALSSLLVGLLVATELSPGRPAAGGGLLALFAVGCPVCNKPALLVLGTAGAIDWFAPLQPLLGGLAVAVLAVALVARLRRQAACGAGASPVDGISRVEITAEKDCATSGRKRLPPWSSSSRDCRDARATRPERR
jgi:hypothetical protein